MSRFTTAYNSRRAGTGFGSEHSESAERSRRVLDDDDIAVKDDDTGTADEDYTAFLSTLDATHQHNTTTNNNSTSAAATTTEEDEIDAGSDTSNNSFVVAAAQSPV